MILSPTTILAILQSITALAVARNPLPTSKGVSGQRAGYSVGNGLQHGVNFVGHLALLLTVIEGTVRDRTVGLELVSDEGGVLYMFPKDYRSKLAAKSFKIKTEPYIVKAKSGGEYLIRVTFRTTLIASILIVFTAIIAILTSSK
ncbi:hypothetical protein Tco_0246506 [Tanacetum coccineum]